MINLILADDHQLFRGGIRSLLSVDPKYHVVGETSNGQQVITLLDNGLEADIILADLHMPVIDGIELTRLLKQQYPKIKIIIVSDIDDEKEVIKVLRTGVNGYLLKSISPDELIFAIRHTFENEQYICSQLSRKFLDRVLTMPDPLHYKNPQDLKFSMRDIEILNMVAAGHTTQEIADHLFCSRRTVENHRQMLIDKTGSRNGVSLVRYAMLNGII